MSAIDAHERFRDALSHYYKTERDRSERCLSDIINLLGSCNPEHQQVEAICERLTIHYSRSDETR